MCNLINLMAIFSLYLNLENKHYPQRNYYDEGSDTLLVIYTEPIHSNFSVACVVEILLSKILIFCWIEII